MKFWKKIFLYSVTLFLFLLMTAGAILIEKKYVDTLKEAVKITVSKCIDVENNLYLNADYLIDVDVTDLENIKKWMDIIVRGYTLNQSNEVFNLEFYTEDNQLIYTDYRKSSQIGTERPEIQKAEDNNKIFIIRENHGRRYVFVSSKINLKNTDFKIVLSKDIELVYQQRIEDYEYFAFVILGISLLLAIGMFLISRGLTRPIVLLSSISKEIAEGDYSKRVSESGNKDEIGILEKNFNRMVDVIENNIVELREHNEAKQRFIDSLNHEIKTPITSIIGYSELLLKSKVNEEIRQQALMYINSEARRIALLNSTLLKLTLIREEEIIRRKVCVKDCVDKAVNSLKFKAESRDIAIKTEVDPAFVYGDKNQLEVLFVNILDNACKASSKGMQIEVQGIYETQKKTYQIRIKDYGVGIAEEDLKKITEPFYMADKARTRKDNGIGLGLAICNEICEKNHITLSFFSKEGEGTEVVIGFSEENIVYEK